MSPNTIKVVSKFQAVLYSIFHGTFPWKIFIDQVLRRKKLSHKKIEITKDTRVSEILEAYGDIADVMEVFGIKRVARYSLRALAAKALTVEWAARIHRVPLDEFLGILRKAIQPVE
jgi:hypothetical protein